MVPFRLNLKKNDKLLSWKLTLKPQKIKLWSDDFLPFRGENPQFGSRKRFCVFGSKKSSPCRWLLVKRKPRKQPLFSASIEWHGCPVNLWGPTRPWCENQSHPWKNSMGFLVVGNYDFTKTTWISIPYRIHGTGIFTYIWLIFMVFM